MRHVFEALSLFTKNRRLVRYVVGPFFYCLGLFLAIAFIGYFLLVPPLGAALAQLGLERAATPLFFIAWVLVSGLCFLSIASFLGSLLWDRLSEEVEVMLTGSAPPCPFSRRELLADAAKRMVWSLLLTGCGLALGCCLPAIAPLIVAGYVGLIDYTASPMARRGVLLAQQRREVWKLRNWQSFYAVAALVAIIPILNVIAMPIMVAAGTVMVIRSK